MSGRKSQRRSYVRTLAKPCRIAAAAAAVAGFLLAPAAQAANYYWDGESLGDGTVSSSNPALWTSVSGGSNWSTSPVSIADPGTAPPSGSNVFFVGNGATNYNFTALGADFSINSLTFTSAATGPIGIGGTNTLTIGAGGITALAGSGSATLSTNVSVGSTAQTWTDNNAVSTDTLGGTFNAGDVINTVVNGVTVSYTVQATDTNLAGVAIGIANAINSNAQLAGLVSATSNGATVNVAGFQGVATVSSNTTGTETSTIAPGSAMTVSGNLSGTGALTLAGTGSTLTPSGRFIFTGANSYSGAMTLLNANTSLVLNGNGTLSSMAGLNLGGGTFFTLDDTGTNVANRLAATLPVNSNGGTINLLGNASAASADRIGSLNLNTGLTNVNVTPGGSNSATLTIASLNRLAGSGVNFSSSGTFALTTAGSLPNGIIGPWATIGNLNNNGNLDFATVLNGNVVPYSNYDTNISDLTTPGTAASAANFKLNLASASSPAVLGGSVTINTLYMTGASGIQINAAGASTNTLTIGAGGIIANGGTTSYSLGNGAAEITNATWIGGPSFSGGTTAATNTENQAGILAVGAGVPDLVVTVGGTYNPVTGLINGALQLNVKNILNTATPLTGGAISTTSGSTTVTLTSGSTAALYPGVAVGALTGFANATQYVVSIIDATHFTVGNAATSTATTATPTFTGNTGLTKDGNGLLDIGDGNANNKTVAYSYAGPVTVNGGVLLIANDANLGAIPASFNPAAIVLNGGELRSTAGLTFNANRGITVGPQGGTITYVGGSTLTLTQKITGPGGMTFNAGSYNGALTYNISNTTQDTYQGPTIIEVKGSTSNSTMNIATSNPLPAGTALTLALAPSFQSGTNGAALPVTGFGALNITTASTGLTIGSLASATTVNGANITGTTTASTLTIGGTSANPVTQSATYNGILAGAGLKVVKNGGGNQVFVGASTYGGTTTINGGALVAENATGSATGTGVVTVAFGGTLGSGFNADAATQTGMIGGIVNVQSGGTLQPTVGGNVPSSLEINSAAVGTTAGTAALTLASGSILNFSLGAPNSSGGFIANPTSDNIYVPNGSLVVSAGADTINITQLSGFGPGTYQLIMAKAVPANFTGTSFTVNGSPVFFYSVVDDTTNDSLDLQITANPNPPLTWFGSPSAGNGMWNTTSTNKPWIIAGSSNFSAYADGSPVTFDSSPGTNAVVSIPSNVAPGSILFNNNLLVSYTFTGAGAITGSAGFTTENNGTITFNNVNTFTGAANVADGTVIVGSTGALGTPSVQVGASGILNVNGALNGVGLTLNNAGTTTVSSTGTLTAGSAVVNTGTLNLNNASDTISSLTGVGSSVATVLNGINLTFGPTAATNANNYGQLTGTGTVTLNAPGDWGTLNFTPGFTGPLNVALGHVASGPASSDFGGLTAVNISGGATAGNGAQLDLSGLNGSIAAPPLTITGSGYGAAGSQAAALLLGSSTITIAGTNGTVDLYNGSATLTSGVAIAGTATIGSNGVGIISGPVSGGNLVVNATGGPTATNSNPGYPLLVLSSTTGNTYTGTTTVAAGTLEFSTPQAFYSGNTANWSPSKVTVNSGAVLALNVGGPSDFTVAQATSILGNLGTGGSTGLQTGSSFGIDTTNATAPLAFSTTLTGPGILKTGSGTLSLTAPANSYAGPTTVTGGLASGSTSTLILNGSNTGTGLVSVSNVTPSGTTVLSVRNANALGSGSANSGLAPINMDAYGSALSASILEIGAKIGTDPGGNNADFSYQLSQPENNQNTTSFLIPGKGQINLGALGNSDDGTGFAAYSTTGAPRIVALYEDPNESYEIVSGSGNATTNMQAGNPATLAPIEEKYGFGLGAGDHLTLGSPTANATLVLLNPVDLNGGAARRFASIRGTGTVPEGEYSGVISNSAGTALNLSFDGNGGLIFDSANIFNTTTIQVNGGAIFVAANDSAAVGSPAALGEGVTTIQIGTSASVNPAGGTAVPTTAGANLGFMTYGPNVNAINGPLQSNPFITTSRNIAIGGAAVTYGSVVLGGATDDYTAMNGTIALNSNLGSATQVPTTFFARNGGRVDFGGVISGVGGVTIGGNSVVVEGDATTPGITLADNGTIVFTAANTYTGNTAVSTGKLYVNGSTVAASAVSVASGATLGGTGTVGGAVTVAVGGNIEAGQAGAGTLTLGGNLTFSGAGAVNFNAVNGSLNGSGNPQLVVDGTLAIGSTPVTINVLGSLNTGNYALIGDAGVQTSMFTLATLPSRAAGSLVVVNGNELDLDITAAGGSLLWTGAQNTAWNTSTNNWVLQTTSGATAYIDNPGDAVIFDDTADPKTTVTINNGDVHPGSVTFNNSNTGSTYTISGANAIAGPTGLTLGSNGGTVILLNSNTFTGPTVINSGTLQLGNGTAGSDGSISDTASISNNGTLIYDLAGSQTYGGIISGSGSLTMKGAGTLILTNNANNYGGTTTITSGTLQLGNGTVNNDGTVPGAVTDNGTLAFDYDGNVTMSSAITGNGAVTKSGVGSLTLSNDPNNFSNGLTINQGSVILTGFGNNPSGSSVGGAGTGLITINDGGTLQLNAGNGSNVYNLANNVVFNGGVLFNTGGPMHVATGASQTVNIGAGGGTLETQNSGQDLFLDGLLTGSGPLAVDNVAGGTSSLVHVTNNANTYSGTITVNGTANSGVQLSIDANNALRNATVNLNGTNAAGSTLVFGTNVTAPVIGAIAGNGNIALGALPLSVGANNASTTYSGAISSTSSLTKAGTGTLSLTNVNTYTGNTFITGGSLKLSVSGLNEGLVNNNTTVLDTTTPFANWTQVSVQPTARWGASTTSAGANVYPAWGNDTTWGYAGYLDNTTSAPVTYTFGKNFDDDAYLSIDGGVLINDSTYTDTVTASVTLSPGLHTVDLLFGQGTGGVGPTGPNYGSFGIGYNTVGNTATSGTWLQFGPSSSNTAFYPLSSAAIPNTSSVVISSNSTFDVSGNAQPVTIGSLADASANPTGQQVLLAGTTLLTGNDNTNTQFSGVISGTAGNLTKIGTGTFTLLGANTYTGNTTITAGTLDVEPVTGSPTVSSLPANSNVINNGTFFVNAPNTTASNVNGTGALQVGAAAGSSAALTTPTFNQASVTINPGAVLALHGPTQAASVTSQLTQNGNGTLDLGGNGIIVNYTGASPLPAIQAAIATGANGGTYTGPYSSAAITSSAAAANSALAIGYGEASTIMPNGGTFLGANVPAGASAVLARTTYGGDATLDGTVNFSDFLVLQRNFNQAGNWSQGDFTGDGTVNFSDFLVLQRNFNQSYTATPSVQTPGIVTAGHSFPSIQTAGAKTSATSSPSAVALASSKLSPSITVSVKSASSTPNVGTSSPAASTPTVTYVLSINDNGAGVATPGSYAVYAMDSVGDNGGIASYEVNFSGAATISSSTKAGSSYGYYDDGTNSGNDVEIGFSALRKSAITGGINTPNLTGSQDTVGANGVPYVAVYGFGQNPGNLASLQPANSTGLDTTMAHSAQTYNGELLLATGTYTGAAPAFVLNTNGTQNSQGANVWVNSTGTSLEAPTIDLVTQTLPAPEPSSLALMGLGLGGLMMRRRRRQKSASSVA